MFHLKIPPFRGNIGLNLRVISFDISHTNTVLRYFTHRQGGFDISHTKPVSIFHTQITVLSIFHTQSFDISHTKFRYFTHTPSKIPVQNHEVTRQKKTV